MVTYLTTINKHFFLPYRNLSNILISEEIRHCLLHVSLLMRFDMAAIFK